MLFMSAGESQKGSTDESEMQTIASEFANIKMGQRWRLEVVQTAGNFRARQTLLEARCVMVLYLFSSISVAKCLYFSLIVFGEYGDTVHSWISVSAFQQRTLFRSETSLQKLRPSCLKDRGIQGMKSNWLRMVPGHPLVQKCQKKLWMIFSQLLWAPRISPHFQAFIPYQSNQSAGIFSLLL